MSKKMAKGEENLPSSQRISSDAPKRPEVPKRPKWLSKLSKERKKPTKDSEPLSSSSKSSVNSSDTKDTFVSYNRIELAKVDKKPGKSRDRAQKGSKVGNQSAGKEKKAEFEKRDLSSGKGQRPWNSSTRLDKPRRRSDSHTSTDSSRSGDKRVNRFRSDTDFKTPRGQPKKSPSKESLTDSRSKSSKQRRETDSPSRRETQKFYTAKKKDDPNYNEENKNREVSAKSPNNCDEQIDFNEKENTPDQPSKSWYEDEPQGLEELQYPMGDDRGPQKGKAHHWGDLPMDKHRDNNYRKPRKYIQEDSVEVRKNIRPGRGGRGRGGMVSSESQESISSRSSMQSQRPQRDNRKGHYHDNRPRDNRQTSRQSSVESLDRYARAPGSKPNSRPPSRPQSRNGPPQDYYYDDNHSSWAPPSRPLSRNGPLQHYNTDNKKSRYRGPPSRPISRQGSVESVDSYGGPPSRPNSRPPSRNGPPPQFWENNRKKGPPSRPLSRQGSIESLDSFGPSSRPSSRPPSRPPSRNGPPLPYAADLNWPRFNYAESVGSSSRRSSEVDSDDDFTFPSGEFWSTFPQRTSVENWSTWDQLPTDPRSSNSLPKKLSSDLQVGVRERGREREGEGGREGRRERGREREGEGGKEGERGDQLPTDPRSSNSLPKKLSSDLQVGVRERGREREGEGGREREGRKEGEREGERGRGREGGREGGPTPHRPHLSSNSPPKKLSSDLQVGVRERGREREGEGGREREGRKEGEREGERGRGREGGREGGPTPHRPTQLQQPAQETVVRPPGRCEREREGERGGGREGGTTPHRPTQLQQPAQETVVRPPGRCEREREGGKEGEREGGREGGREEGRERGWERGGNNSPQTHACSSNSLPKKLSSDLQVGVRERGREREGVGERGEQLPTDPRSSNSLPKKLSSDLQVGVREGGREREGEGGREGGRERGGPTPHRPMQLQQPAQETVVRPPGRCEREREGERGREGGREEERETRRGELHWLKITLTFQRELARQTAKEHRPKIGRRDSIESWDGFPRRTSFQDDRMYLSQPEDSGSARTHPGPRSRSRNRKRNRRNRRRSRSGQQGQGPFGHQNPNVGYSSASELSQDGDFKPPSDTEVQLRNRLDDVLDGSLSSGSMSPIPESDVAEFPVGPLPNCCLM
ncbi:Hypp64 [Branchiostoma lanceolatum]|uniref:Hypp64 protein n=1 Tax=Branchiostoma lanceolatum TaxID=7740 RepID=A0A8J9V9L7_BRALA|nr:Hypp64 [Branchiostoma lanceolatum]